MLNAILLYVVLSLSSKLIAVLGLVTRAEGLPTLSNIKLKLSLYSIIVLLLTVALSVPKKSSALTSSALRSNL